MPRWVAIAVGAVTALPILYAVVFIAHVLSLQPGVQPPPLPLGGGIDWHLLVMALTTVLLVFYLVATFALRSVPRGARAVWVVALIFGNVLAFPFFWYLYFWQTSPGRDGQAL